VKGGGHEGQGPKNRHQLGKNYQNRTNQAQESINDSLNDISYMAWPAETSQQFSQKDWILDSGTTSHICTIKDAFINYIPSNDATITGIGPEGTPALGIGTVAINFDIEGKQIRHLLRNTLHAPNAPNCLVSISRLIVVVEKLNSIMGNVY
jgi:hypothetical protein